MAIMHSFFRRAGSLDRSQKDFKIIGPNKVELSELPLPQPPSGQSLELQTRILVRSIALLLGANSTGQTFDLSGKKREGRAVALDMPSQPNEAPCKILAFVAKSGKHFRQFYFAVPAELWKDNAQQYLAILRTLKFPLLVSAISVIDTIGEKGFFVCLPYESLRLNWL